MSVVTGDANVPLANSMETLRLEHARMDRVIHEALCAGFGKFQVPGVECLIMEYSREFVPSITLVGNDPIMSNPGVQQLSSAMDSAFVAFGFSINGMYACPSNGPVRWICGDYGFTSFSACADPKRPGGFLFTHGKELYELESLAIKHRPVVVSQHPDTSVDSMTNCLSSSDGSRIYCVARGRYSTYLVSSNRGLSRQFDRIRSPKSTVASLGDILHENPIQLTWDLSHYSGTEYSPQGKIALVVECGGQFIHEVRIKSDDCAYVINSIETPLWDECKHMVHNCSVLSLPKTRSLIIANTAGLGRLCVYDRDTLVVRNLSISQKSTAHGVSAVPTLGVSLIADRTRIIGIVPRAMCLESSSKTLLISGQFGTHRITLFPDLFI